MKRDQLLFRAFLLIALGLCVNSSLLAQNNNLPSGLTENSSLEEVLKWLDSAALARARIGLNVGALGTGSGDDYSTYVQYPEWAVFSQGFRLAKIDGCNVTLRNDNLKIISFSTTSPHPEGSLSYFRKTGNDQTQFLAELIHPTPEVKS